MKILVDEIIPKTKALFSPHGQVKTFSGRDISPADLTDIDTLLVRSVTPVNAELLASSPVKFVGTSTIGTDHIDLKYLKDNNIGFASAPGCNAIAVAEYILSGLFVISKEYNVDLRTIKVGIVGAGNVGSALATRLGIVGIPYGLYDPPLHEIGDHREMITEDELAECDILSIHVPLTNAEQSKYPTLQMVNRDFLERMKACRYIFNTSRGAVVSSNDLCAWLKASNERQAIIDVWENEPDIDQQFLKETLISTPHIAGHTYEGKVRGCLMLYLAFCQHFQLQADFDKEALLTENSPKDMIQLQQDLNYMQAMSAAIWNVYDIRDDDKALRAGINRDMSSHFDRLRRGYKMRRECSAHRLDELSAPDGALKTLKQLGFKV